MSNETVVQRNSEADVVERVMKSLLPLIEKLSLTPDKINELKKPYVDPEKAAQDLAHRKRMQLEIAEGLIKKKLEQDNCDHITRYQDTEKSALRLMFRANWHDGKSRAICMNCDKVIHPARKDYRPDGSEFVIPEDPEYNKVLKLEMAA
jgi:hypothetical protein